MLGIVGVLGAAFFVLVLMRPVLGAYLLLFSTPLIAGIERGPIPLRPNEMVLLLVLAALATRRLLLMFSRQYRSAPFDRMDLSVLLLAVTSSAVPLLWMVARGDSPDQDDLLYSVVLVKYFLLYRVFRTTIVTEAQVATCLRVSMASAGIEGLVAILQVMNLFGVPQFLFHYYDQPFSGTWGPITHRGTSTLALAFSSADLMTMNLVIALSLYQLQRTKAWLLMTAAGLYLAGCLASGEFSGYIGLAVALLAFGYLSGSRILRLAPVFLGLAPLLAIPTWPVIAHRFGELSGGGNMPSSWNGRIENLQRFFFPQLFDAGGWIMGVRPAARVMAPQPWHWWVFIECGYAWILWTGGLPLLIAYFYFLIVMLKRLGRVARLRADAVGVAAAAGFCFMVALSVLMVFDAHLTMRGTADLMFPLLAMSQVQQPQREVVRSLRGPAPAVIVPVQGGILANAT